MERPLRVVAPVPDAVRGLLLLFLLLGLSAALPGCSDDTAGPAADTTPPTVVTTFPTHLSAVATPVTIRATADDNVGVRRVSFLVDGSVVGEDTAAPYEHEWFVYYYADGNQHSILARAVDAAGNAGQSALVVVTVLEAAAGLLQPIGPEHRAEFRTGIDVAFNWHPVPAAGRYGLEVDDDSLFSSPSHALESADTSTGALPQTQGTHFWRVRAIDTSGVAGPWSVRREFLVDGPVAPGLTAPADRAMVAAVPSPVFSWATSAGAVAYAFELAADAAFTTVLLSFESAGTDTAAAPPGAGAYHWRVRGRNAAGLWGGWSETRALGADVFTRTYGGAAIEWGRAAAPSPDGGFLVAGETFSGGAGMGDLYLVKTDSMGVGQWEKTYGTPQEDGARSVVGVGGGGYIACGFTRLGPDDADVYLVRTDGDGNLLWSRTYGGPAHDYGVDIVEAADGGFVLTGTTFSTDSGTADLFLLKVTASGDSAWLRTFGGGANESGAALARTADGGYVALGSTESFGAGNRDIYLVKSDADGAPLWSRTYGTNGFDDAYDVIQTDDGGFLFSGTNYSMLVVKTDAAGVELWNRTFGDGQGMAIASAPDGGYILAGNATGGTGSIPDIRLVRLDAAGTTEWNVLIGGPESDSPSFVLPSGDGGFVTGGFTYSFGAGEADVLLIRTNTLGETILPLSPDRRSSGARRF